MNAPGYLIKKALAQSIGAAAAPALSKALGAVGSATRTAGNAVRSFTHGVPGISGAGAAIGGAANTAGKAMKGGATALGDAGIVNSMERKFKMTPTDSPMLRNVGAGVAGAGALAAGAVGLGAGSLAGKPTAPKGNPESGQE